MNFELLRHKVFLMIQTELFNTKKVHSSTFFFLFYDFLSVHDFLSIMQDLIILLYLNKSEGVNFLFNS